MWCQSVQHRMSWRTSLLLAMLFTESLQSDCRVVRSPYPVSDQCYPVPECQHKCHIAQVTPLSSPQFKRKVNFDKSQHFSL